MILTDRLQNARAPGQSWTVRSAETARTSDLVAGQPAPQIPCLRTRAPYAALARSSTCNNVGGTAGSAAGAHAGQGTYLYYLLQGSAGTLAAISTPPTTALLLSSTKEKKKCRCNVLFCMLIAEGKIFCFAKKNKNKKNVTCEDSFGAEAAWLGAWCGLGGCLGSFLFFRDAMYSARVWPADPLALPNFSFLFPPRVQQNAYL